MEVKLTPLQKKLPSKSLALLALNIKDNVYLLFLQLKLSTKQDMGKERTHLFLFIKSIKKNWRKNKELADEKNWVLTVMIKKLLWEEFNLYWKFTCTDKNNDQIKKNLHPPLSSTIVTVFLIDEKLLSLWLWNFKTFSLFLLPVLVKLECNCLRRLFFITDLLKKNRKKTF